MIDPIRSRIRNDILGTYEEPSSDLARRALAVLPARQPQRSRLQIVAVTAALLAIAILVLIARGTHILSVSQEASHGAGLRPPVAPYSIVDNQFVSASTGWILIQMHVTSGPLVLLKTSDGGAHWVEQFRYTGQGGISDIRFAPNGRDGWMTWIEGGAIAVPAGQPIPAPSPTVFKTYVTSDGGDHWVLTHQTSQPNVPKSAPQPAYFPGQTVYLPDGREGWQVLMPSNQAASAPVMHTADGGTTWTQVGLLPPGVAKGQLTFTDAQTGWISLTTAYAMGWGAQGQPIPSAQPAALLYVTRDGGATWTPVSLPLPAPINAPTVNTIVGQPLMLDASHGLLAIQLMPGKGDPFSQPSAGTGGVTASYVVKTSDGGHHWGNLTQVSGTPGDGDLLFVSFDHWLTTKGGVLSETTDGGKSWSTRRVLADGLSLSLAQWDYVSPNVIWAQVGAGSLVRSVDGGKTWTAVTPPQVK